MTRALNKRVFLKTFKRRPIYLKKCLDISYGLGSLGLSISRRNLNLYELHLTSVRYLIRIYYFDPSASSLLPKILLDAIIEVSLSLPPFARVIIKRFTFIIGVIIFLNVW